MIKYISLLLLLVAFSLSSNSQSSDNLSLVGSLEYPNAEGNDIWGYVDSSGIEYALMGLTDGFSVVDLSDPTNPTESFFISGPNSTWRDIKVWGHYAFVTADEGSAGLLIVDLDDLTGNTFLYTNDDFNDSFICERAHNIYIDENGKAYLFGGNIGGNNTPTAGAMILDVTSVSLEPGNIVLPTILGIFEDFYLHDGMVRGDTLWGSAVYEGNFFAIDVSVPNNPQIFNDSLAFHETPNEFTHNCWISDDGNTLFTTDETSGAYIASYDVSDLSNISELDRIRSSEDIATVIPHNVHVKGDFLVSSYYRDGIVVHDVKYPNNMIEVAHYDAFPQGGDGFDGSWGAYPYLPSGLILSSEINSGTNGSGLLLVLEPEYVNACYLEGNIKDSISGFPISNATIDILSFNIISATTNLVGDYVTGQAQSGNFEVVYNADGYFADTLEVELVSGELIIQNIALLPENSFSKNGRVIDQYGEGIANANIRLFNGFVFHETISNNEGFFFIDTLYQSDNYILMAGKWEFITSCQNNFYLIDDGSDLEIVLNDGYYDDFAFDFGWEVSGTAVSGIWESGEPYGIISENQYITPPFDISTDCYSNAFVTGNSVGPLGGDDVDNGVTILRSPVFDISSLNKPAIEFHQWFVNFGGWSQVNDSLIIMLTNSNSSESVVLDVSVAQFNNEWQKKNYTNLNNLNLGDSLRLEIIASDYQPNNHWVEAAFDGFYLYEDTSTVTFVSDYSDVIDFKVFPNPANNILNTNFSGTKRIISLLGREVLRSNQLSIDISSLSSGVYIIVHDNQRIKFIKN